MYFILYSLLTRSFLRAEMSKTFSYFASFLLWGEICWVTANKLAVEVLSLTVMSRSVFMDSFQTRPYPPPLHNLGHFPKLRFSMGCVMNTLATSGTKHLTQRFYSHINVSIYFWQPLVRGDLVWYKTSLGHFVELQTFELLVRYCGKFVGLKISTHRL